MFKRILEQLLEVRWWLVIPLGIILANIFAFIIAFK